MSNLVATLFQETGKFLKPLSSLQVCVRHKAKKTIGTIHNAGNARPKHRGWKYQDGNFVKQGTALVTQTQTRFHPGLHVGFGRNGTLYALESGRVVVTAEKINPEYRHFWVRKNYTGREGQTIYKKHFHVIPEKQHDRFILKDAV